MAGNWKEVKGYLSAQVMMKMRKPYGDYGEMWIVGSDFRWEYWRVVFPMV
jgi:hypothetical protein